MGAMEITENDMIERVARALCEAQCLGHPGGAFIDANWPRHTTQARAAIEAMREPTSEMNRAGCRAIPAAHGQAWIYAPDAYTAMIDVALAQLTEEEVG